MRKFKHNKKSSSRGKKRSFKKRSAPSKSRAGGQRIGFRM